MARYFGKFVAVFLLSFSCVLPASAVDYKWLTDNGNINAGANWEAIIAMTTGVVPNTSDVGYIGHVDNPNLTAIFNGAMTGSATLEVESGSTLSLGTITTGTRLIRLDGGTLSKNNGLLPGVATIGVGTTYSILSDSTLENNTPGALTLSGTFGGSGKITKTGSGDIVITANATTFTGDVDVNAGTLQTTGIGSNNVLWAGTTTVKSGGTLDVNFNSPAASSGNIVVEAGGTLRQRYTNIATKLENNSTFAFVPGTPFYMQGSLTLGDNPGDIITYDASADSNASTPTIQGIVSGPGKLVYESNGTGYMELRGVNTFSGGIDVESGFLRGTSGSAGAALGTGTTTIKNGATLHAYMGNTAAPTGSKIVVESGGNLRFTHANIQVEALNGSNLIYHENAANLQSTVSTALVLGTNPGDVINLSSSGLTAAASINSIITGPGKLVYNGTNLTSATAQLTKNAFGDNTFSGGMDIQSGLFTANGLNVLGTGTTTVFDDAILYITNAAATPNTGNIVVQSGGFLKWFHSNNNALIEDGGSLLPTDTVTFAGQLTLGGSASDSAYLYGRTTLAGVAQSSGDANISGQVTGPGRLIYNHANTGTRMLLSNVGNNFAGGVDIQSGRLVASATVSNSVLGTGTTNVRNGAVLELANALLAPASGTTNVVVDAGGTLRSNAGNLPVLMLNNSIFSRTLDNVNAEFAGTLTLGTTAGDVVQFDNNTYASGSIFNTISGQITGPGKMVYNHINNTTRTVLNNATNNWTGGLDVQSGVLRVGLTGALPDVGTVTITSGATLEYFNAATSDTIGTLAGTGLLTVDKTTSGGRTITLAEGLSPGIGAPTQTGTLTFSGTGNLGAKTLALDAAATALFYVQNDTLHDQLLVTNTGTGSTTLDLGSSFLDVTWNSDEDVFDNSDVITLINATGAGVSLVGTFGNYDFGDRVYSQDGYQSFLLSLNGGMVQLSDFIQTEPIPEPNSLLLLSLGTVIIAARRRRRRQ